MLRYKKVHRTSRYLQADTAPIGMRNMAKNRGPRDVVPVAIAFPTAARSIRPMICRERSSNRADVHVTVIETSNVANYRQTESTGNAVSN